MYQKSFLALALIILFLLPSPVLAGALYGTILNDKGKPLVGATVTVTMEHSHKTYPAAGKTDGSGAYRVLIPETGRGTLTVAEGSDSACIKVYVFKDSVRWNLIQIRTDAQIILQKR